VLTFIVNLLLGVSWGLVIVGAVNPFLDFKKTDLIGIFLDVIIGIFPGIIALLFLEHFITTKEKYFELQKQTKLLEQIYNQTKL